jgi:hypothetical protein
MLRLDLGKRILSFPIKDEYFVNKQAVGQVKDNTVYRDISDKGPEDLIRYFFYWNDVRMSPTTIYGFMKGENHFHIERVQNRADAMFGAEFMPLLYRVMEADLRDRNVSRVSTTTYPEIAKIMIRRFGFTESSNFIDHFRNGKLIGLEKLIDNTITN